jgi:hypothetical protein
LSRISAALCRNLVVTNGKAACETRSATWNLGTNSAFALGTKKIMENLPDTSYYNSIQIIYNNPVRTSQETHYISATKPNRLMLFRETVAVYCENHMEHTDTLCGQNAGFWYVKADGKYSDHWALEG